MRILIAKNKKTFFVRNTDKDYHCQYGYIKGKDLKKAKDGDILVTNTGKELTIMTPSFIDIYKKIKRGAQIIPLKDIGHIITTTGINKSSIVVEAGAGSGALTCFLGHLCKKVYSYEIREDFMKIVQKNINLLDLKNIVLKDKDIYDGIDESNVDLVSLDLPEPWRVIPHAKKALKKGGFLISYSPSIPQTMDFVNKLDEDLFHYVTYEIFEREWEINQRKVRPKSQRIGHSGFLSFARRIK